VALDKMKKVVLGIKAGATMCAVVALGRKVPL
jgi:hypothetical protein